MRTEVIVVDPHAPDPAALARAARLLRDGGLVAFPTETVYGLGANAFDVLTIERLYVAKGRPAQNPLIVHVAGMEQARELAEDWPETAARLAAQFWPGPLTLVVRKRPAVPDAVTAGGATVALRVPAHPVALALLRATGLPVAAPSANRSSGISPTRAGHVLRSLDGRIDLVLDGGPTSGGLESTVVDVTTTPPRLLRPGLVALADLEALLGPLGRAGAVADNETLRSPGMMVRHYAPSVPLECVAEDAAWERVRELCRQGRRVGWLALGPREPALEDGLRVLWLPREPRAYAAELYAALHALDEANVECIVVTRPPLSEEWLAVQDRLRRAAAEG